MGNMNEESSSVSETPVCIHCKCNIEGKPWITVDLNESTEEYTVENIFHACKYMCSRNLKYHIGNGYWDKVVNKEDFPGPRPVSRFQGKKDITVNFGINEILSEIVKENKRMDMIEAEYYDNDNFSDEDIY